MNPCFNCGEQMEEDRPVIYCCIQCEDEFEELGTTELYCHGELFKVPTKWLINYVENEGFDDLDVFLKCYTYEESADIKFLANEKGILNI